MSEPANKKHVRANLKEMTDEQRQAHVRARGLRHARAWRERHPEYTTQRMPCECGGSYLRQNKTGHLRTLKHQRLAQIARLTQQLERQRIS